MSANVCSGYQAIVSSVKSNLRQMLVTGIGAIVLRPRGFFELWINPVQTVGHNDCTNARTVH